MFNRAYIVCLLLFLYPVSLFADERAKEISKALIQVQEKKADAETWEGQNSAEPYVVLLNEYETKINPDWSYTEMYHSRIQIQQQEVKELGQWPVYYNKNRESIESIQAFVETPQGKKTPTTNIEDLEAYEKLSLYEDLRVKVINLPEVDIGSIIDVTVKTKVVRKEMANQFWDEIPEPFIATKFARHTYIFPSDIEISFKLHKLERQPIIEKKGGLVKYSFIFEETAFGHEEDLMPPKDEITGSISLSSLKDWSTIATWYRDLIQKNTVDSAPITVKTMELIKDKKNQTDKARAIMEFMQDHFRYVAMNFGDHMLEPHTTTEIYKNRYGDCKDISLLTQQMMKIAGIEANAVLMSSEFTGNPQNSLPNPSVFEHMLLEVELDGKKYFVDVQNKGFDLGQFPSTYDNAYVMIIDEDDIRFDRLPIAPEEERSIVTNSDIKIKPDGSALFEVHVQLPLEASQGFRKAWESTAKEDKDKFFQSLEANFSQGGTVLSHDVKGLDERYGPLQLTITYESPNAYPMVNDMILLKEADQSDLPEFSEEHRKYSIFVPTNSLIKSTNVYHVPLGYGIDFMPINYELSTDMAKINLEYAVNDDVLTVNSTYRMKRALIDAKRYAEIQDFRRTVSKKNEQYVVLKKKPQTSNEAKEWLRKQ